MYAVAVSFVLAGKLLAFKGLDVVSKLIREMGDDGKKLEFYPILSFLCVTWQPGCILELNQNMKYFKHFNWQEKQF